MRFFALNSSRSLGTTLAEAGGFSLDPLEERDFGGGQHKSRPLVDVQGHDVFVLAGSHAEAGLSANDRLIRLMFFLATCRDHGAARVTAIVPSLPYARKDRRTQPHDPLGTRYVAQAIEAMGTDAIVTIEAHNRQAFENAFRIPALHLDARAEMVAAIAALHSKRGGIAPVIVSPDTGGIKRAQLLREALDAAGIDAGLAFHEKRRVGDVVSGALFAGDVDGSECWILDDMIVSGETMLRAASACRARGASAVHLIATHALMDSAALDRLATAELAGLHVTDASGLPKGASESLGPKLNILPMAPLLAQTILALRGNLECAEP
ncbi:hypothetical protein B6V74_00210 [Thioclava sp. F42-5]|uniref:ribose-phosphate diphosphokinase n=1 Tax=Thioclava sp. F42-5 TaxID=1973005 RepID=UPI000B53B712|nr:ribose-phosphate diphosphokinase [Thioclava sp. F42-5]OWY10495.1 hypothetical protein B6V74_00210 [Thioclava sp. F42-5]